MPRAASQAWRDTAAYREMRAVALNRYGRVCRLCLSREGPFEVDHIVPAARGQAGRLLLTNLQVLCVACHRKKHSVGGES